LRDDFGAIGDAETLWLDREPTTEDVIKSIQFYEPLDDYSEVVFCGFGEPFSSFDVLIETAKWLKQQGVKHVRVNTNGLGDLIVGRPVAPELAGLVDEISISLNAPDAQTYVDLCVPEFGDKSFDALIDFAKAAKGFVPRVSFSVVDFLEPAEIQKCKDIAAQLDIPLRVRLFS